MNLKDIKILIKLISKFNIKKFYYQSSDIKIHIKNNITNSINNKKKEYLSIFEPKISSTSTFDIKSKNSKEIILNKKYVSIRSPMIGTFYQRPSPDKEAFIKLGDKVENGQPVCVIEAMKLFNEIESEVSGRIVKILVEDASPVEYNQELFLVDPS